MTSSLGPEPGNPPPGHTEWTDPQCGCVIQYNADGEETLRWSCFRYHSLSQPHPGRPV